MEDTKVNNLDMELTDYNANFINKLKIKIDASKNKEKEYLEVYKEFKLTSGNVNGYLIQELDNFKKINSRKAETSDKLDEINLRLDSAKEKILTAKLLLSKLVKIKNETKKNIV